MIGWGGVSLIPVEKHDFEIFADQRYDVVRSTSGFMGIYSRPAGRLTRWASSSTMCFFRI